MMREVVHLVKKKAYVRFRKRNHTEPLRNIKIAGNNSWKISRDKSSRELSLASRITENQFNAYIKTKW